MNFLDMQYLAPFRIRLFPLFLTCTFFLGIHTLKAEKVLESLRLDQGNWVMIGIPIHNNQMLPVQEELGTFTVNDRNTLLTTQQQWNLPLTLQDKCDYHYELKFYQDGNLKKTFKVNLFCGTLFDEGISYKFDPHLFEEVRNVAKPVDWSRITFNNLDVLRKAITLLKNTNEVYWYKDVKPYYYSGYFLIRVAGIPWDADMDEIDEKVRKMVYSKVNSNDFYLQEYLTSMKDGEKTVKYTVYCDEQFSNRFGPGKYIKWRSHFYGKDSLQVVAIGIDLRRYQELMGMGDTRTRNE